MVFDLILGRIILYYFNFRHFNPFHFVNEIILKKYLDAEIYFPKYKHVNHHYSTYNRIKYHFK